VFTMKDASGTTILSSPITLGSSYPYVLKVDINQVVDKEMFIAATMNGVAQTPTNNFIVRSSCKPLSYSTLNGVETPYAYQVPTTY